MEFSTKNIGAIIGGVILLIVLITLSLNTVVYLGSSELMVMQSATTGELTCFTDPGPHAQFFAHITKWPRRDTYDFETGGTSKLIRFNDGGHANIYGSVSWEMPLDCPSILKIQKTFGSPEGVTNNIIDKMINTAVYNTGPLMSSKESATTRRTELLQYISDQAINGVFLTEVKQETVTDPITGQPKTTNVVEISKDAKGIELRQQASTIGEFGIKLLPLSVKEIRYDAAVEAQIKAQQESIMAVQTSIAKAQQAQQDAVTSAAQGQAQVAKAKADQDAKNAVAVSDANRDLQVQQLNTQKAALYKQQQILEGEGDAAKKAAVMNANGGLDQKLAAYIEVQKTWASAFEKYNGQMVPGIVMGGSGGGNAAANAQSLVDLLTAKTAKDLSLDLFVGGASRTAGRK